MDSAFEGCQSRHVLPRETTYVAPSKKAVTNSVPTNELSETFNPSESAAVALPKALPVSRRRQQTLLHAGAGKLVKDLSHLKDCNLVDDSNSVWFKHKTFPWHQKLQDFNGAIFGNRSFLPLQAEVINAALSNEDVFVMLPTGGGKSLCYQLTALIDEGVTVCIMPLVSLMQDQHDILFGFNINAKVISGNLTWQETKQIYLDCEQPDPVNPLKIIFVTPEKIGASDSLMTLFSNLHQCQRLSRFVIDEAHCVSQWGNDFRPEYKTLKILRQRYADVPILALTASATVDILEDVLKQLRMRHVQIFRRSFDRPNLKYSVHPRTAKTLIEEIVPLIKQHFKNQCGIVYWWVSNFKPNERNLDSELSLSRANCDDIAAEFQRTKIKADRYHGGMSVSDRERVQRSWMAEEFQVMVATIAFGMGINKRDVRFVIHMAMPKCIENYYQVVPVAQAKTFS
eukprot:Gregarina_sp_Poly_1__129@NODE_102_length_14381_cov_59_883820_g89_i0_p3_GENE_NODE_102_length_14381_cov_59_883820_g89_i0NODE_102_length_14381_cov_59_883820_g89_i0_p3_ORF_typecomplete_len455_score73_16DEAD/PF00270_29/2_2e23DEAD/PF00270_29/2_4e02Helicase_C/PF00271_31/1_2e03Helicase_C/PF00271_31/5_9e14ResIII/PF04851_15/7_8e06nec1/PF10379_9/0_22_NODE_102_length_14381_cov_59_883820_g89_i012812645